MDNKTYVSRVEENLKYIADYLKNLKTISYENIISLVKKDAYNQIQYYDRYDIINDVHYSCVSILKNNDTSTNEEYKTMDQDARDVYNNTIALFKKNNIDSMFQIITNYDGKYELICNIGKSIIIFPKSIVKELMACSTRHYNKNSNEIYCIYGNKELFLPSFLKTEEKEKTKTIK